jgi:protein TonB
MNARAIPWLEDEDPRDLRRWGLAALIVVGIHCAAIAAYLYVPWPQPVADNTIPLELEPPGPDDIDLAPVAPAPEQMEKQEEEKPPPPPPPEESKPVVAEPAPQPVQQQQPQMPTPLVLERSKGHIDTRWTAQISNRLNQFKRYPSGARARGEEGIVMLGFTMDRAGHILDHEIVKSSGFSELDNEATALLKRADPLPAIPADITDTTMTFTVPIRFSLRQ